MIILIATPRAVELSAFADALAGGTGGQLRFADAWPDALSAIKTLHPAFVVIDEGLNPDTGGPHDTSGSIALARELVMVNPMVNAAVVSPMDPEAFHEASEGLGILARIPASPTARDGAELAQVFRRFL